MPNAISKEWDALKSTLRNLDRQTITVLTTAALFVIFHHEYGSRTFFRSLFAGNADIANEALLQWTWWFGGQFIAGFVLPVSILLFVFKNKPSKIGLGLGDWKLAIGLAALYVPAVLIGCWVLSNDADFLSKYPHHSEAARSWSVFLIFEAIFVLYWIGWEYLWRGYVLFGTAKTFGVYAIFVQALPFAVLHINKPFEEAILSIVGAIALGALVWRCRSFWIAVPIHAFQMLAIDFFCSIRSRSGVDGLGLDDLVEALSRSF